MREINDGERYYISERSECRVIMGREEARRSEVALHLCEVGGWN